MDTEDVTKKMRHDWIDDDMMMIEKCICGFEVKNYGDYGFIIISDKNDLRQCPECGRRFYWEITIYEVT